MGISLTIVKKDCKRNEYGKVVYPIYIKYSYKNQYKRFPTNTFTELKYWKDGYLSNRSPNYTELQKRLTNRIDILNEIISQIGETKELPTPSLVGDWLKKEETIQLKKQPISKGFWNCYEIFLRDKEKYNYSYKKTLDTLHNKLKIFEKETKNYISFDYVIVGSFEIDFKKFCLDTNVKIGKGKHYEVGLSNNYINKLFSNLRIFLNWCKEQKYITDVKKFKIEKIYTNDELVFLNSLEVNKMWKYKKLDYPNNYNNVFLIEDKLKDGDVRYWNNLELVKDIFTFMCSIGCRWGDIKILKVGMFKYKDDYFNWTMEKTKSSVLVPQNEISKQIFFKYSKGKSLDQNLFPIYSSQKFNEHIKEVGKILKFNRLVTRKLMVGREIRENTKKDKQIWELLSSHSGRRSFIKNLIDLGTMDNWTIMKLSGHKTISSFQKYVSVVEDDIKKGKHLYSKEFFKKNEKNYFEMLEQIPLTTIFDFIQKNIPTN